MLSTTPFQLKQKHPTSVGALHGEGTPAVYGIRLAGDETPFLGTEEKNHVGNIE